MSSTTPKSPWVTQRPGNHYQYFLNSSGPPSKTGPLNNSGLLGPGNIFDFSTMETPRDIALLRMSRQIGPTSKPIAPMNVASVVNGASESIAMHQRKLADTEARIDHALDLVTRSFGVNRNMGIPKNNLPRAPEVRKIRETLIKTQRSDHDHRGLYNRVKKEGGIPDNLSSHKKTHNKAPPPPQPPPTVIVKKRKSMGTGQEDVKSRQDNHSVKSRPTGLQIYKTTPTPVVITSYIPPRIQMQKNLSRQKIDRSQTLQISVVDGITHVYQSASPNFVNTFANMKAFNTMNESNPAGLPRYRASIDMNGFLDSEISLQCDGKKVIISGNRRKKSTSNARKVTEILELPAGVFPEKLRIARDANGVLHIEERWTLD